LFAGLLPLRPGLLPNTDGAAANFVSNMPPLASISLTLSVRGSGFCFAGDDLIVQVVMISVGSRRITGANRAFAA
jgi:hypothetical protein